MSLNVHIAYVSSRSQHVWHHLLPSMPQGLILREGLHTSPSPPGGATTQLGPRGLEITYN